MEAGTSTPVGTSGESPPLFTITSEDQRGVVIIVAAVCLTVSISSILIRTYVRWEYTPRRFAWDDFFLVLALVVSVCQSAVVFLEVHDGFGKSGIDLSSLQTISIQKATYADEILYIVSVWLSKVSIVFLLLRLSPKSWHRRASLCNLIFLIASGVTCVLLVALRCDISRPWLSFDYDNTFCNNLYPHLQTLAALDIVTEIFILATATYMICSLQMKVWKKTIILIAFSLRLFLIAPIILHLLYLTDANTFTDPSLQLTRSTLCKQIEICYAIVAATIPVLRPFMVALTTHYGGMGPGSLSTRSTRETDPSTHMDNGLEKGSGATSTSGRKSKTSTNSWPHAVSRTSCQRASAERMQAVDSFGEYRADISSGQPDTSQMIHPESSITVRTEVQLSVDYQRGNA